MVVQERVSDLSFALELPMSLASRYSAIRSVKMGLQALICPFQIKEA